jgi:YHS domain-containing protein
LVIVFIKNQPEIMKRLFTLTIISLSLTTLVVAKDTTTIRKKNYNLEKGVAIEGYDPVAYFTENKAIKGSKDLAVSFQGVTYYFSSVANKEAFKNNPSKYEPQYGGWCAYAMGREGSKVEVDPETFKIIDNKLYLFYNKYFNNTLKSWNKDEVNLKMHAGANWQKIFH